MIKPGFKDTVFPKKQWRWREPKEANATKCVWPTWWAAAKAWAFALPPGATGIQVPCSSHCRVRASAMLTLKRWIGAMSKWRYCKKQGFEEEWFLRHLRLLTYTKVLQCNILYAVLFYTLYCIYCSKKRVVLLCHGESCFFLTKPWFAPSTVLLYSRGTVWCAVCNSSCCMFFKKRWGPFALRLNQGLQKSKEGAWRILHPQKCERLNSLHEFREHLHLFSPPAFAVLWSASREIQFARASWTSGGRCLHRQFRDQGRCLGYISRLSFTIRFTFVLCRLWTHNSAMCHSRLRTSTFEMVGRDKRRIAFSGPRWVERPWATTGQGLQEGLRLYCIHCNTVSTVSVICIAYRSVSDKFTFVRYSRTKSTGITSP